MPDCGAHGDRGSDQAAPDAGGETGRGAGASLGMMRLKAERDRLVTESSDRSTEIRVARAGVFVIRGLRRDTRVTEYRAYREYPLSETQGYSYNVRTNVHPGSCLVSRPGDES